MYPDKYISYLLHFHADRDYFECHELLEEYWKSLSPAERSALWVGLIQIAVSLYHHRRSNFKGATKMLESAITILSERPQEVAALGLDAPALLKQLREHLQVIEAGDAYVSLNLPLTDDALRHQCEERAKQQGHIFGVPSDMGNHFLLNKHTLRNRADVIALRERNLEQKRQQKGE